MDKTIWKFQTTNATDFFGLRFLVDLRWLFDARTFGFEVKGICPNSVTGSQANTTSKNKAGFTFTGWPRFATLFSLVGNQASDKDHYDQRVGN